jgi:hypothetical protein
MVDYVVYHKAEKMGYPVLDVGHLAVYTKKPTDGTAGSRIWLIAGEGSPRSYFLRATFLIKSVEHSDRPDFISLITGTDGQLLDPMPQLNGEPWMKDFVKEQGRIAFGFNRIKNCAALDGLRNLLLKSTLR